MFVMGTALFAQTNDLVIFSEKGEEFTLYVNSIKQNETPAANVKAKDIKSDSFMARIVFVDKAIPEITQNFWTESKNVEITAVVVLNKKGKYVLRPMGEGPKNADSPVVSSGTQATYEDPDSDNTPVSNNGTVTTTTTVTTDRVPRENIDMNVQVSGTGMDVDTDTGEESVSLNITANENGMNMTTGAGDETLTFDVNVSENGMNMNTGVGDETLTFDVDVSENGMDMNTGVGDETLTFDVDVSENGMDMNTGVGDETLTLNIDASGMDNVVVDNYEESTTTTYTTTTTTTTTGNSDLVVEEYHGNNYSGGTISRCPVAMSATEFAEAMESIKSKSFEDTKLTTAKQICKSSCMTADQIRDINKSFGFEDSRLEFAKYAYDYVYDASKYYKVNDSFQFEMTIEELDEYLQTK